ncbi:hypothetical protein DFH11DRAFT_314318 [Phellopilus nigrolimitatus]|nr:hypothetical protein DFH11DRAFT_314318 [Phellopilus nigrolimitatus]
MSSFDPNCVYKPPSLPGLPLHCRHLRIRPCVLPSSLALFVAHLHCQYFIQLLQPRVMVDSSRPTASNTLYDNLNEVYAQVEASLSESSISTTATADDLPGPGRLLGNLYMFLGRRLETAASRFMEKRGYGPEASRKRLAMMCYRFPNDLNYPITPIQGTVEFKQSRKEVKRLLEYAKSKYASNQELALEAILDLAIHDHVRQTLIEFNAAKIFGLVALQAEAENCDQLLSPSRKALICLVDVDINDLGKRILELHEQWHPASIDCGMLTRCISHTFQGLVEKAQSSFAVSFLAFRYIEKVKIFVLVDSDLGQSLLKIIANALLYMLDHAPSAIEWSVFTSIIYYIYLGIIKPTEENIELVRALAARSLGNEHDSYKEIHRDFYPELYFWESRPTAHHSSALVPASQINGGPIETSS